MVLLVLLALSMDLNLSDPFAIPKSPGVKDTLSDSIGNNRVRVASYNVCAFGAGFKETVDTEQVTQVYGKLQKDLKDLKADIVCLNEVKRIKMRDLEGNERDDTLESLAEDLDMEHFFAHANPGYENFGNAILVNKKLQVIHCDSTHLEGGSSVPTPKGDKHIGRGCLAVCVTALEKSFAVLATHLDHISEAERLRQAESILSHRQRLSKGLPHLLVGDLNAMKRSDYSEEEWAALEQRNLKNRWSPPEDSTALLALEAAGYQDMHEKLSGDPSNRWTLPADPPARIDYIFASHDFSRVGRVNEAFVAQAIGSDHLPTVLDILL